MASESSPNTDKKIFETDHLLAILRENVTFLGCLFFCDHFVRLLMTSNYIGDRNVTNWMMWGLRYSNCIPFFARTFAFPPTQKTILLLIFVETDTFSLMKRLVVQELIVLESRCILFPLAQECLGCHGVSKTMCFDTPGGSGVSIGWIKLVWVSMFNFFGPSCSFFGVGVVHNFPGNNSTGHLKHEKISNDQVQLFFGKVGSTSCNCEVWTFWCFFSHLPMSQLKLGAVNIAWTFHVIYTAS